MTFSRRGRYTDPGSGGSIGLGGGLDEEPTFSHEWTRDDGVQFRIAFQDHHGTEDGKWHFAVVDGCGTWLDCATVDRDVVELIRMLLTGGGA